VSRVAAVDCGTNSIRLLITEPTGPGDPTPKDVLRRNEIVRLGQGVDRSGVLSTEALERTRVALEAYAADIRAHEVVAVRMVATSATRDARNRAVFVQLVQATLGVVPEVVTGAQEAALSFAGATAGLTTAARLVCDIGGGSTELVRGDAEVLAALSVDIGCVRLHERHGEDLSAIEADAATAVQRLVDTVPVEGATELIMLAGTATTVAALALGLTTYEPERIHRAPVTLDQVDDVVGLLVGSSREQIADLPVMHPGRVDVITAGALILRTVVRAIGLGGYTASESDILDGIAASITASITAG
jgi:exopolyphosphatase/guanosine-5'-triphosphate,3'-diphosphate pyrophosphatase